VAALKCHRGWASVDIEYDTVSEPRERREGRDELWAESGKPKDFVIALSMVYISMGKPVWLDGVVAWYLYLGRIPGRIVICSRNGYPKLDPVPKFITRFQIRVISTRFFATIVDLCILTNTYTYTATVM